MGSRPGAQDLRIATADPRPRTVGERVHRDSTVNEHACAADTGEAPDRSRPRHVYRTAEEQPGELPRGTAAAGQTGRERGLRGGTVRRMLLTLLALWAARAPAGYVIRETAGCIRWQDASTCSSENVFDAVPAGALCRRRSDGMSIPTDSTFSHIEHALPVGVYDKSSGQCMIMNTSVPSGEVELAVTRSTQCDVWWRYLTEDVAPPMSALALQFGSSGSGRANDILYSICRTHGENPRLGTLHLNGPDVSLCIVPSDGQGRPETTLRGGGYDLIEARQFGGCTDETLNSEVLKSSLKSKLDEFLTPADHKLIARSSGHDYTLLEMKLLELGSCDLSAVLSDHGFVPHDLNRLGLVS